MYENIEMLPLRFRIYKYYIVHFSLQLFEELFDQFFCTFVFEGEFDFIKKILIYLR